MYSHKEADATKKAIVSDSGRLAHTPFIPYMPGSMSSAGMRKMSWRESDRNIEILALPIDWKKLDITICAPMKQNARHDIRSPFEANSIRVVSVVKRRTTCVGRSCAMTKPNEVTIVPAMMP